MADQATFTEDVEPYLYHLQQNALRFTKNFHDSEDLVQETLLRAYRGYHGFREGTNLRAWLDRIMTNHYINTYRKKQRSIEEVEIEDLSLLHATQDLAFPSAEDEMLASAFSVDIVATLNTVSHLLLVPVLLVGVESMSYRKVAEVLDVPIGTVMSRVYRGRKAVQKALWAAFAKEAI